MKYNAFDSTIYYKKKVTPDLVKRTIKLFVLMPMKDEHCVMCQALKNNRLLDNHQDHSLYKCLTQFMILEYIKCKKGTDKVNDAHVKTYVDQKWLRLGPKLMREFRDMGVRTLGNTIPIRYR